MSAAGTKKLTFATRKLALDDVATAAPEAVAAETATPNQVAQPRGLRSERTTLAA